MSYQHEDESPCVHHRSAFDTIPAPPPSPYPSEPTMLSTVAHVLPAALPANAYEEGLRLMREPGFALTPEGGRFLSGQGVLPADMAERVYRSALGFPGGEVELPKPTRADLVLSARQWATRAKEELFEFEQAIARPATNLHEMQQQRYQRPVPAAISSALDRLDAILKELADVTR